MDIKERRAAYAQRIVMTALTDLDWFECYAWERKKREAFAEDFVWKLGEYG
jgi:hypothetical protein